MRDAHQIINIFKELLNQEQRNQDRKTATKSTENGANSQQNVDTNEKYIRRGLV